MGLFRGVLAGLLLASSVGFAAQPLPHFDLDMTGAEYTRALEGGKLLEFNELVATELDEILRVGQRNLEWLNTINQQRSEADKLSFSTPDTQLAYPVEQPKIYNPTIIQANYEALIEELPSVMKEVLVNGGSLTSSPPLAENDYLIWGLRVDRAYQNAARWRLLSPHLSELAARRARDIRGYYFFAKVRNLKEQLDHWADLGREQQQLYRSYLIGMCLNNSGGNCERTVDAQVAKNAAYGLYARYLARSQQIFRQFFVIGASRSDVKWDDRDHSMHVPFVTPEDKFQRFLKDNIEDEWKWDGWRLFLNFVANASPYSTPHLVFVPGATPHVNRLAGNEITMDENAPITEYNVRWTIRHEYGHVLGFPDCYHEFYDSERSVMISYQLDITDLMCSRRGHLKERHYGELKRVYR